MTDGEQSASFGALLRQHRLQAGLTQEALAERSGVSLRALQYLERSGGQPQRETARRLSEALALTAEQRAIFDRIGAPAPRTRAASARRGPRLVTGPQDLPTPAAAPDDLSGEYKHVAILVADIPGLTDSTQEFEPARADRLLSEIVPRLAEVVRQYEGTVNRSGDGVMAIFGAPVAREDDTVRACHAALALHELFRREIDGLAAEHRSVLALRVGIASGEVVIRAARNGPHQEYTAIGPAVRTAGRLAQLAGDGTTLVSPETARLAEGQVGLRPAALTSTGGTLEPADAYELTGPTAAGARTRRIFGTRQLTRFVGREPEIHALAGALERASAGRGQIVALVGEPGVGKSRLVWELTRSARAEGWRVLETGATATVYPDAGGSKATSYLPAIELLKAYCRIESRDDERTIREKVTTTVAALDEGLHPTLPALLALLDVPPGDAAWDVLDAAQRRRQTLDGLKRLLLRESREQPLLLVIEDLHWIDAETQSLLDSLADGLPTARIVLVVTYRPEYSHAWGSRTYYTQLRIDPLGQAGSQHLLTALLGQDGRLDPLKAVLSERTEGNPLFLEESVRSLVETGRIVGEPGAYRLAQPVLNLRVPPTVQAVLAARIDRLPSEQKHLLQTAAAIGKDVPVALLNAIADRPAEDVERGLSALQAAELLYEASLFPELAYTFKHALTHEVAYRSLLQDRRRELHGRVVRAVERLYADRLAEHVERLAHHALRAELWEPTAEYSHQAGLRLADRSADREAVAYYEAALAALSHLPASRQNVERGIDLRAALHLVLFPLAEIARLGPMHQEQLELSESIGDEPRLCRTLLQRANLAWRVGRYAAAIEDARRGYASAERLGLRMFQASGLHHVGNAHHAMGEYREAIEPFAQIVRLLHDRIGSELWDREVFFLLASWSWLAYDLAEVGDFGQAVAEGEQAVAQADATGHAFSIVCVCGSVGHAYLVAGRLDRAIALLERARDVSLEHGYLASQLRVLADLGVAYALRGELEPALAVANLALTTDASNAIVSWRSGLLTSVGHVYVLAGRLDDAERLVRSAVAQATERGERGYLAHAQRTLGEILAAREPPDHASAQASFRAGLALAEDLGLRPLQAHCHLGLGKLSRRLGRPDDARAELSAAATMLRDMDMARWLPVAEFELKFLL